MTTPSGNGRKRPEAQLLVVEDNRTSSNSSPRACLRRIRGDQRQRGHQAVQAAPPRRSHWLDVMLPDMDGFDVVRRLRGGGDASP
jgi:two-component system OmpR family response regulator